MKYLIFLPLIIIITVLIAPFFISSQTIADAQYARMCLGAVSGRLADPNAMEIFSLTVSPKGPADAALLESHIRAEYARVNRAPDEAMIAKSIKTPTVVFEAQIIYRANAGEQRSTALCSFLQEDGPIGFLQSVAVNDQCWDNRSENWGEIASGRQRFDSGEVSYKNRFDALIFSFAGRSNR